MAITNAQQARQLYNEGGPMRKIKGQNHMLAYITPNEADKLVKLGGQETMTPEGILAYPEFDNYSGANTPGGAMSRSDFEGGAYSGTGNAGDGVIDQYQGEPPVITPPSKPPITKDNFKKPNKFITPTMAVLNFLGNKMSGSKFAMLNNKLQRNNYLATLTPEEQVEALEDLSKIGIGTDSPMGIDRNITRGMGDRGLFGTGIGGGEFITDIDVGGPEAKAVLGDGYTNYQEEQRNRFNSDEGGEGIIDPCKGPNPPAYCFTGLRSASAATPEVEEEDEIINYRLMADGGRAAFAGGGKDAGAGSNFGNENFSGGNTPGPGDTGGEGGNNPTDNSDTQFGGGGNGPPTNVDGGNEPNTPVIANPNFSFGKNIGKGLDPKELARFFNEFYGLNSDDDDETKNTVTVGSEINTPAGAFVTTDNAIDTVFSPTIASDVQTVRGTGLDKRIDMYDRVLEADGGRIGLAEGGMPYEGGIMDLESSRQMYGLGKLVKKITRGVKKIAKSPIGKAALLYAGGTYLGGLSAFGGSGTFMANLKNGQGIGNLVNFGKNKLFGELVMSGNKAKGAGYIKKGLLSSPLGLIGASSALSYFLTPEEEEEQKLASLGADIDDPSYIMNNPSLYTNRRLAAEGGSMDEPVAKKTMPLLDMDGKEMDLREEGGFVPLGRMERADDVPARLSKNEFVFTADAVRNAGEGDVDKGAEVMYNMMKNLESGGDVSEESQGLEGAREMFQTSQRLEEVI